MTPSTTNYLTSARRAMALCKSAYELAQVDRSKALALDELRAARAHLDAAIDALKAEVRS
jgi:Cdc6-like AAA superfamily ATPase